jgi:2-hydroxychromene-2-carboxylate isomerase
VQGPAPPAPEQPVFYYDLGSPDCYLLAEQVMHALPVIPEWVPVLASGIEERPAEVDRARIEQSVRKLGLQELRWPKRVPAESRRAMLAATYAKQIGRGVSFSLAAFRQAFAGGQDLASQNTVLVAGAACEIHPAALLQAFERSAVAAALERATASARRAGAHSLPAILAQGQVFCGQQALDLAAAVLEDQAGPTEARPA